MKTKPKRPAKAHIHPAQPPSSSSVLEGVTAAQVIGSAESLKNAGKIEECISLYRTAALRPEIAQRHALYFNLASTLSGLGRESEAEAAYHSALELSPNFAEALVNLGLLKERAGKSHESLALWKQAAEAPENAERPEMVTTALNHMGRLQEMLREYESAEESLRRSLAVNPRQQDALHHWVHLRQKQCKWPAYGSLPNLSEACLLLGTSALAMLAESDDPVRQLLAAHATVQRKFNQPALDLTKGKGYSHARLRIGYLSSDLCTHAVGMLLPEIFQNHDRTRFETFGFCTSPEDGSALRQRLIAGLEHFHKVGHLPDEAVAHLIRSLEIDILVDLNGLSSGTRIGVLNYRPAPVQVTWLGFIGTTAHPQVDYVLTDAFAIPSELEGFFTEKPLRLPHCFLPRDSQRTLGAAPSRAQYNLPENAFIFASFNNIYKINPTMFGTWMRILQATPHSVLWLLDDNRWATENLRAFAQKAGVAPERLIFAGRVSPADHLARLPLADLFLDNHPYNAGSTATDVLAMELPMLTLSGRTFVSRMGGSLLTSLGLPELITHSHEQYQTEAIAIASDPARIPKLKQRLREAWSGPRAVPGLQFARNLEAIFENIVLPGASPSGEVPVSAPPPVSSAPVEQSASARYSPPTPPAKTPSARAQKKLLVRGWRDINHSFSLVNQFQLLAMLERKDIQLFHEDVPYLVPQWSAARNGSGFTPQTTAKIAAIPSYRGENVDAILTLQAPLTLYRGTAKRIFTFIVTEFELDPQNFGADSPPAAAYTEGRHHVVTPSHWSKNKLIRAGMNPDRIAVVPHGVDSAIFQPLAPQEREAVRKQIGAGPEHFMILNVGGAFWNKGGDLLLRAFAELHREFPFLKLFIKDNRSLYGLTIDDTVKTLSQTHPGLLTEAVVRDIVTLPGTFSMEQMRMLYGAADLYASPYRAEGFNLPVLEAAACGCPVLVTRGGATDDFFEPFMGLQIESKPASREIPGAAARPVHYQEPDYEDLKNGLRAFVLRKAPAPFIPTQAWLDFRSWKQCTQTLLEDHLLAE